ncbi:hypothetical protein [Streptomyces sp. NPDC097619]|uniref:hypothetical protein n=1 Tax=Streptomyces sp. NPDC097619 TaxID=3157228 RepID=UPI00331C4C47
MVTASELDALALPVGDDGVVIGVDEDGLPAVLGVARPTPYGVTLVGGLWAAQVLALRAAATGVRVAVETGRSPSWAPLARAAGGDQQCVTVHAVGRVPALGSSVAQPVLVLRDCGASPPRGTVPPRPWQTVLTLLPHLGRVAPGLLRRADLVGLERVSPEEAGEAGRVLELPGPLVEALPGLGAGVTLWCAARDRRFAVTEPTEEERGLLGEPRRVD